MQRQLRHTLLCVYAEYMYYMYRYFSPSPWSCLSVYRFTLLLSSLFTSTWVNPSQHKLDLWLFLFALCLSNNFLSGKLKKKPVANPVGEGAMIPPHPVKNTVVIKKMATKGICIDSMFLDPPTTHPLDPLLFVLASY